MSRENQIHGTEFFELSTISCQKSEVGGFRKLLTDAGLTPEELPRRPRQPGAVGKEKARYPKLKNQMPEKFTCAADKDKDKCKGKTNTRARAGPGQGQGLPTRTPRTTIGL